MSTEPGDMAAGLNHLGTEVDVIMRVLYDLVHAVRDSMSYAPIGARGGLLTTRVYHIGTDHNPDATACDLCHALARAEHIFTKWVMRPGGKPGRRESKHE